MILMVICSAAFAVWAGAGQDPNFRLIQLERRLDLMQTRIDMLDRDVRQLSVSRAQPAGASPELVLEMQRQQLSQAEQLVLIQRKLLDLQKGLEALAEAQPKPAKSEKPEGPKKKN
jgi:hypothetical protein